MVNTKINGLKKKKMIEVQYKLYRCGVKGEYYS